MSTRVETAEAPSQFEQLVDRAASGEEIVVTRGGKPMARLVPLRTAGRRQSGQLKGLKLPNSFFFDPLPKDELDRWE